MFVWLSTDCSPRVECWPLPFSSPLSFRRSMLWCSALSMFRKFLKYLSTSALPSDICSACQSIYPLIPKESGMPRAWAMTLQCQVPGRAATSVSSLSHCHDSSGKSEDRSQGRGIWLHQEKRGMISRQVDMTPPGKAWNDLKAGRYDSTRKSEERSQGSRQVDMTPLGKARTDLKAVDMTPLGTISRQWIWLHCKKRGPISRPVDMTPLGTISRQWIWLHWEKREPISKQWIWLCWVPMGSPSRGGVVSRLSLPTPFSPIFVCPSAYRNLSPVLLFTLQLLPTYLQFSSSDCPFCLHRPFTYTSLSYKPSFAASFFLTHFQSLEVGRCLPSGRGENRASTHNDKHGWLCWERSPRLLLSRQVLYHWTTKAVSSASNKTDDTFFFCRNDLVHEPMETGPFVHFREMKTKFNNWIRE